MNRVLITGAARGIGRCLALEFAKHQYEIILCDIDESELKKLSVQLYNNNKLISHNFSYDVSDKDQVYEMAKNISSRVGGIDILINNAGIGYAGGLEHTTIEKWEQLMGVNFWGPLYHVEAFLPRMKQRGSGQIVNISSGQANLKMPSWGAYSTSKAAMSVWSEILAIELKKYGIHVTTVYPFMVNTPFYKDISGTDTFLGRLSMKAIPYYSHSPETVARKIYKAIKNKKRRETISIINDAIYYAQVTPAHTVISKVVDHFLNKKDEE